MPNISTSNSNQIYKYVAQITTTFKNDQSPTTIDQLRFKSIIVDYNYDEYNFPLIYCNVNIPLEWIEKLVANQKTGTLVFTLQKYVENSDMPGLKVDVINEECIYFMPSDDAKDYERAYNEDKTEDIGLNVTIGLISLTHINAIKKVRHGCIKSGTMSSILYYLLNGHTLLIEPLKYNPKLNNFVLPAINSLSKMVKYLNNYQVFYDTQYRFFIDFGVTYLLSSSGKGVKKKGDQTNKVKFVLWNEYEERNMEGMNYTIESGMYTIDCSGSYSVLSETSDSSASFSSITGVGTVGAKQKSVSTGMREKESPIYQKTNYIRIPNNNTGLIDNMTSSAANNARVLSIAKNKIDTSIVSVNKEFYVDASRVYGEEYSGTYLLSRKRELYKPEGEGFAMSLLLSLKRLANQ